MKLRKVQDGVENEGLTPWGVEKKGTKLGWKGAVLDPPCPSEGEVRVNPTSTGQSGKDRHLVD